MNDELEIAKTKVELSTGKLERTVYLLFSVVCQEAKFLQDIKFLLDSGTNANELHRLINDREKAITEGLAKL